MLNKGNRLKSSNFTHSLVLPFCCFCGTYGLFTLMNNCNILWAFLTSDISSVPLWLVSPHRLVCYMHCWQPWGERDCHIVKFKKFTREENQYNLQQRFSCVTFLRVMAWPCYVNIVQSSLSFVLHLCDVCHVFQDTHCAIWMQNNSEMYFLHGTALFIPFALLLLQVRSMRNQGQGQRQSHLTSVTGFTFITIGCDHARSGSFIVKNHDNWAAAQKVCHRYGMYHVVAFCSNCGKPAPK